MRGWKVLMAAGWLALSVNAWAGVTGQELLGRCAASEKSLAGKDQLSGEEMLDAMWCMGYMSGLLDGFSVGDYKVGDRRMVCAPDEGLTRTDAMHVVVKWLREHPEAQPKSGRRAALVALAAAYPCK
jgi:hypothetical protein